jgi:hypothetical protein
MLKQCDPALIILYFSTILAICIFLDGQSYTIVCMKIIIYFFWDELVIVRATVHKKILIGMLRKPADVGSQ